MQKAISSTKLSETLTISLCNDGYWLYDKTRGMNISKRAKTSEAAFVEALTYYQKRLSEIEGAYKCLKGQVDSFVSQFIEEDNE
jgi:hypothetical protein